MKQSARITLFAGHYGSGKTNLAVNYAAKLKKSHKHVSIVDLDIVNPYFRTKDSEDMLNSIGVRLISSSFANSNLDAPSLPADALSIFHNKETYSVIDVGGDDRGAYAVGRYAKYLLDEQSADILFVINCYRPLTSTAEQSAQVIEEIERAAHIKFNGIINNSNLGAATTPQDVINSVSQVKELTEKTGLPIVFTSVREEIFPKLNNIADLFPIKIMSKNIWRV